MESRGQLQEWFNHAAGLYEQVRQDVNALTRLRDQRRRKQANTKWAVGAGVAGGIALLAIGFLIPGLASLSLGIAGGVSVFTNQEAAIDNAQRDLDDAETELRNLQRETDSVRALTASTVQEAVEEASSAEAGTPSLTTDEKAL